MDVQIIQRGTGFALHVTVLAGDGVSIAHEMPIAWAGIGERARLGVLGLYTQGLLLGARAWRRRISATLRRGGVGRAAMG